MPPDYSAIALLPAPLKSAIEDLTCALTAVRARPRASVDLLAVEGQVRELVSSVERASIQMVLQKLDIDAARVTINGLEHRRVGRHEVKG